MHSLEHNVDVVITGDENQIREPRHHLVALIALSKHSVNFV